jgi:2-C-methyl-D-erythritol 2,4-cyclodiphosphate synthase
VKDAAYEYRTGIGTDIHRLVPDRPLILGGVQIPYELGLLGHSDADAVLHAVIDALLGAAGLGDIGTFFPDTDPQWKNADSSELTMRVRQQIQAHRWEVVNADLIIHVERPKLGPYKGQIRRAVAGLLETDFANVNVKAKTGEGLGPVGEGQAVEATAIVLLRRPNK